MAGRGLISKAEDKEAITDMKGHSGMKAWDIIQPGEGGSMYLRMLLDEFEPGGGIAPHYHEITPCDHAYYVISGKILAMIGGKEEIVGPNTLIYCTTDVVHSLKNVGQTPAKLLRIGAAADGVSSGKSVFIKA